MDHKIFLLPLLLLLGLTTATSDLTPPLITDHQFNTEKESTSGIGILVMHKKDAGPMFDKTVTALSDASETFKQFGVSVYTLDCNVSNSDICQDFTKRDKLLLYKNGDIVTDLSIESISSKHEAEGNVLHWLDWNNIMQISNEEEWKALKEHCFAIKNIVFVYSESPGSMLHSYFIKESLNINDRIQLAYSNDYEFVKSLFGEDVNQKGDVWLSMCAEEASDVSCRTVQFAGAITPSNMDAMLTEILSPSTMIIDCKAPVDGLQMSINKAMEDHVDVLMLIAGQGKHEKAEKLARTVCAMYLGKVRCIVITGDAEVSGISSYVTDDRIHLSILAKEGQESDLQIGNLVGESAVEVAHRYEQLLSNRKFKLRLVQSIDIEADSLVSTEGEDEELKSENDIQDDPVAFSVHSDKYLRDLYLFDHYTIPRVTDVMYDNLISNNQYSVMLFTLEFNAKSLAVLSTFVRIHKEIIARGETSPMYRVECHDWPDVCQKAGFSTFPRMVIYKANESTPIEYSNIWSEAEMKKAVKLFSMAWPHIIETSEEIDNLHRMSSSIVYGLVSTQAGESIFREAARMLGDQHLFVLARGHVAKSIAEQQGSQMTDKNILLAELDGEFLPQSEKYSNVNDIINFIDMSFNSEPIKELTISNFEAVLSNPTPLFIHYKNISAGTTSIEQELSETLTKIASGDAYMQKAQFMWMDSSPNTPGEYTLYMHSGGKPVANPVAFFSKQGYVSVTSFSEGANEAAVMEWTARCLAGMEKPSFKLLDMDWSPRLPGHDFLQYMLEEGILPVGSKPALAPEEEDVTPTNLASTRHFGVVKTGHKSPPPADLGDLEAEISTGSKPSLHSEL